MATSLTIPITATSSEPLSWEALETLWKKISKLSPTRWYYARAKMHIDDWIKPGTIVLAKEYKEATHVMKEEGTRCRVLTPTLANIMLEPLSPDEEYSYVSALEEEALDAQWFALRQVMSLISSEAMEAAVSSLST